MRASLATAVIGRAKTFLKPLLGEMDAWRRDFLPRLIRGVARSQGLVVTEIVREAFENPEEFRAGYKSFSRHLNSAVWDEQEEEIDRAFQREMGRRVKERTIVAVDDGDLAKPYARKMENLGWVRDADKDVLTRGYWGFEAYGVEDPEAPFPLVNFAYDLEGGETPSRQHARRRGYEQIARATGGRGLIVEDRGFDGEENFRDLKACGLKWLIRQVGNRVILDEAGERLGILEEVVARWTLTHVAQVAGRLKNGKEQTKFVAYDWRPVRLPGVAGEYWLIAVRGSVDPREEGLYLLTSDAVLTTVEAERMIRAYHHRWRAEDSIRFMKSELGLEGVRTLNFRPLRRLVRAAYWTMAIVSELRLSLTPEHVSRIVRQVGFFPRPVRSLYYRILAGLRSLWTVRSVT